MNLALFRLKVGLFFLMVSRHKKEGKGEMRGRDGGFCFPEADGSKWVGRLGVVRCGVVCGGRSTLPVSP